jgi:Domain of unknown function (DUF4394)
MFHTKRSVPVVNALAVAASLAAAGSALGQFGYGVTNAGLLFRFELSNPNTTYTEIGNVGFTPVGIDFRPGTSELYALSVGPNTSQLHTININSGASTPVGAGFASSGAGYDLTGNQTFGFDFNPTTLQADNSMRIRLVSTGNANLRLNSSTGLISNVDTQLQFANGASPFISGAAYINSAAATQGGTTSLYGLDTRNNALVVIDPPNFGTVTTVGQFGVTINNTVNNVGFDILTAIGSNDPTIGGDTGYAVLRRPDAPVGNPGAYLLYNVNLATGLITNGALVGTGADFQGGFAVLIPAPASAVVLGLGALAAARRRRNA